MKTHFPLFNIIIKTVFVMTVLSGQENNSETVAVLPLTGTNIPNSELTIYSDRLDAELFKLKNYIFVERELMSEILTEQGFQQTGCTTDECAVKIGELLGVKFLITGSLGKLESLYTLNLKMIENIDKPALSGLWPNKNGTNIVLDLGANVECNEKNLIDFSLMGSALFKALFPDQNPKVALLNIGSEEIKGNEIIKNTYKKLNNQNNNIYEFKGYIEGNEMMSGDVNVIVTDGFTGNVALKTAEGTANFITNELKEALTGSFLGKFLSILNIRNINKFRKKFKCKMLINYKITIYI